MNFVNPSAAGVVQNKVNTMAADALDLGVTRPSAMILTQGNGVLCLPGGLTH